MAPCPTSRTAEVSVASLMMPQLPLRRDHSVDSGRKESWLGERWIFCKQIRPNGLERLRTLDGGEAEEHVWQDSPHKPVKPSPPPLSPSPILPTPPPPPPSPLPHCRQALVLARGLETLGLNITGAQDDCVSGAATATVPRTPALLGARGSQ
eukprot:8246382-Pyramimonas_sp.AAC.1